MKAKPIYIIIIFLFASLRLNSQPVISYIFPDIGAPNMNTYVEIIGPITSVLNFGNDGFYINSSANVRVECLNAADNQKITFGPAIVSWNGRMIATQVYVNPKVTPNSSDWRLLTSAYRIPIRVYNALNILNPYSNVDTFYIVQPYHLGDVSGNAERVLGAGTLGFRSRRGAMLIDSLIIANATYTVSTNDPDNTLTNGNQGYLPFVLLSKGVIRGSGTSSVIALNGSSPHAAPGGGGGGGAFCDNFGGNGINGGDGFTGGGPGGNNNSFMGNSYRTPGKGSGADVSSYVGGASLNGVPGGSVVNGIYECASGGTGHPFGSPGAPTSDGAQCLSVGGYGGGAGCGQNQAGGSGGYATDGADALATSDNGGKSHGSLLCVPLAGGSGGASGNPQIASGCSASGGGGGGAVRVSASKISTLKVTANGGNGGASSYGNGGSGSGGAINLTSKMSVSGISMDVTGGANGSYNGGSGRVREDLPKISTTVTPTTATQYRGISSDTSNYVPRTFTLTGTKQSGKNITAYLRSENGSWTEVSPISSLGVNWSVNITLPLPDSIFYFVMVQNGEAPTGQIFTQEPLFTMSQAAANVFRVIKTPKIEGDSLANFASMNCPNTITRYTVRFQNSGEANLVLQLASATWAKGAQGFSFSPTTNKTILPSGIDSIIISFTVTTGMKGIYRDTLIIPHNDTYSNHQPWKVYCEAVVDTFGVNMYNESLTQRIDTLNFGKVCINTSKTLSFYVRNESPVDISFPAIAYTDPVNYSFDNSAFALTPNQSKKLDVTFESQTPGKKVAMATFVLQQCPGIFYRFYFAAEVIAPVLGKVKDTVDFGKICINTSKDTIIKIANKSGMNLTFINTVAASPFSVQTVGSNIVVNSDSLTLKITYNAIANGLTKIYLRVAECQDYIDSLVVKGEAVSTEVVFTNSGDFGKLRIGRRDTLELKMVNNGPGDALIEDIPSLGAPFTVLETIPATLPLLLKPGDIIIVKVEFAPVAVGIFKEWYETTSEASSHNACPDTAGLLVKGEGINFNLVVLDNPTDFGNLYYCETGIDTIILRNTGEADVSIITDPAIIGSEAAYFSLLESYTAPVKLNKDDEIRLIVKFTPDASFSGTANAEIVYRLDDDMPTPRRIMLTAKKKELDYSLPVEIDLGNIPLNVSSSSNFNLVNNMPENLFVNEIKYSVAYMQVLPNQLTVAGNSSSPLNVSVTVSQKGAGSAYFDVIITSPCPDTTRVLVKWNAVEGSIAAASLLSFKTLFYCEGDTIRTRIYNTGASAFNITGASIIGVDAALFDIVDVHNYPESVPSNDSVFYTIAFKPGLSVEGLKTALLKILTDLNSTPVVNIALEGNKADIKISVSPESLSFGIDALNNINTIPFTVTNNSIGEVRLARIETNETHITVLPANATIVANGGSQNFTAELNYYKIGLISDSLLLIFDEPCLDTLVIPFTGTGIEGSIFITQSIDFGVTPFCETKFDSITVKNTGNNNVEIQGFNILGQDLGLFSILSQPTLPQTLSPNDSIVIYIEFSPQSSLNDGIKTAQLETRLLINNQTISANTNLTGERYSGSIEKPLELSFGEVLSTGSKEKSFTITNNGKMPLTFDTQFLNDFPDLFTVTPSLVDTILQPSEFIEITVVFHPSEIITYSDKITFSFSIGSCQVAGEVLLGGSGAATKPITVWTPVLLDAPTDVNNYQIPIYASFTNETDAVDNLAFTANLTFNKYLFEPISVSNGSFSVVGNQDSLRTIQISASNIKIDVQDSVLAVITGSPLLGYSDTTQLVLSDFVWTSGADLIGETTLRSKRLHDYQNLPRRRETINNTSGCNENYSYAKTGS